MEQASGDRSVGTIGVAAVSPRRFVTTAGGSEDDYLRHPEIQKLVEFFEAKGLSAIKSEDRQETWYDDWLQFQAKHRLYATVLSPASLSAVGGRLDWMRLVRFIETFAYFSPAHGYSLQVTFLGLIAILMGTNDALKQQAITAIEGGGLLAFGISEQHHGSDLFGNEFTIQSNGDSQYMASGSKYYIGNAQIATMIAILARKHDATSARRSPFVLFALRQGAAVEATKIHTSGVRAAYVGQFSVKDYAFDGDDLIADGRGAWQAVFGAVTLGKFLLGFASIGICEHALAESVLHLATRELYGKRVVDLPHIRALATQAYARLSAMKLFGYRALDYVHAASADDRRYELFNAVQKAKVGVEGVKVMALLGECVGAKGFEADTYIEMARRDVQLIPAVEGSTHVNLSLAAQFVTRYFARRGSTVQQVPSLVAGEVPSIENEYLLQARTGAFHSISFGYFLEAYKPLMFIANVRLLAMQAKRFSLFVRQDRAKDLLEPGNESTLLLAQLFVMFVYAQLVAEACVRCATPAPIVSTVFHGIVEDVIACALAIAASSQLDERSRAAMKRLVTVPRTSQAAWRDATVQMLQMATP